MHVGTRLVAFCQYILVLLFKSPETNVRVVFVETIFFRCTFSNRYRLQCDSGDDQSCRPCFSQSVLLLVVSTFDVVLQDLFTKFSVVSLRETILGGNQWLSENTKLEWSVENDSSKDRVPPQPTASSDDRQKPLDLKHIVLTPMQIRTFVAEITPNSAR